MYLKKIIIKNYGCIKDLNYQLPFNEDATPKPISIIGKNGSGKTLLLSNIIHSLIEFKRKHYQIIPETIDEKLYRSLSKKYINNDENYSYINYQFSEESWYTDLMTKDYNFFKDKQYNIEIHKDVNLQNNTLVSNGFYYNIKHDNNSNEFNENVFLYFPVDRYYIPTWLNRTNSKLEFNCYDDNIIGQNSSDMIKNNVLDDIEKWILDVIIDKYLYEQTLYNIDKYDSNGQKILSQIVSHNGKNTTINDNLNYIISKILVLNNPNCISARLGVSRKKNRNISIVLKMKDGTEKEFVPNFSNLSSGEIMILSIFASILKEYDRIAENTFTNFSDIKGIVIIDEIDAHLHSDFCRFVLPEIIKMFSGIQFIVSSHSPFFLLGMKESFNNKCEFLDLPDGTINNLDNFYEIKKLYELVYEGYEKTLAELRNYREKLNNIQKPIIITEGKTDWKHLKNALINLKNQGKFTNLNLDFFQYEDDMGDSNLEKLLMYIAKISNHHKIIGLFDNDEKTGQKYDKDEPTHLGNNVYGWCIPNPRNLPFGISIEFLYEDNDIKKYDTENRRLYLSDEFNKINLRLKNNPDINCINKKIVECSKRNIVKIIDSEIFDSSGNSIALSKDKFAENILNKIPPFDIVDVKNFEEVFNRIQNIIDNY